MLIFGRRWKSRHLGFCLEFCLDCRGLRAHWAGRDELRSHLYYICWGSPRAVKHKVICLTCRRVSLPHADRFGVLYIHASSDPEAIARATPPHVLVALAKEQADEIAIASGQAGPPARIRRAVQILHGVEDYIAREAAYCRPRAWAMGLSGALAMFGLAILLMSLNQRRPDLSGAVGGGVTLLIGIGLMIASAWATTLRRRVRRFVLPSLGVQLQGLVLSQEEAEAALNAATQLDLRVSRLITAQELWSAVQRPGPRTGPIR